MGEYLERHDPVEKAERALKKAEEKKTDANLHVARHETVDKVNRIDFSYLGRDDIRQIIKHEVMRRDRGQCTHVYPNGRRCKERRYLEMHHIRPVSMGGPDTPQNLTLLCSNHHKYRHLNWAHRRNHPNPIATQQSLALG